MRSSNLVIIKQERRLNTIIQTPTSNLKNSLNFYSKLNFEIISGESPILVSDGKVVIEINTDRFARAGIKLFNSSWKTCVDKLEKITTVMKIDNGYLLADPSGTFIYLIEIQEKLDLEISKISPSILGNYEGISLETIAFRKSEEIWKLLGFKKSAGSLEKDWVSLINKDGMTVNLMIANSCPHLFFNPSLTYFNGKNNLKVIEKVRESNVPITEEITCFNKQGIIDNIIIRDPGGLGFFLFND